MANRKVRLAPPADRPHEYHPIGIALSRARSMASVLEQLGETGPYANNLVSALRDGSHPEETLEWLHSAAADSLRSALDEIGDAFRKSLTPEQAKEQMINWPPKAVA